MPLPGSICHACTFVNSLFLVLWTSKFGNVSLLLSLLILFHSACLLPCSCFGWLMFVMVPSCPMLVLVICVLKCLPLFTSIVSRCSCSGGVSSSCSSYYMFVTAPSPVSGVALFPSLVTFWFLVVRFCFFYLYLSPGSPFICSFPSIFRFLNKPLLPQSAQWIVTFFSACAVTLICSTTVYVITAFSAKRFSRVTHLNKINKGVTQYINSSVSDGSEIYLWWFRSATCNNKYEWPFTQ